MTPATIARLVVAAPFAAALIGLLLPVGRAWSRRVAAWLGVGGAAVALGLAAWLLPAATDRPHQDAPELVRFGEFVVTYGVRVDQAAGLVAVAVAAVALAVQVYSVAYLVGDDRYPPYAAQVSLFTAAMLLVVVAGDLVLLLIGWEVMGVCSYLLIAHDRRLPEAPDAARKAFLVTRVGDVGFWLGVVLLAGHVGSLQFQEVNAAATNGSVPEPTLTLAALLLLVGVAGKSAQFPLHTWLPDAMAGPTPVSALIHAATMVAAGVYVVFRLYPVFVGAGGALAVLAVVAAVTMLLGALAATAADDIKRVLAWSTVSQLAYMFAALAVGATAAALFHLLTHAAFKALLFLAAGAVIHAVATNSMSAMGGLRRTMPVTFWAMTIGLAALAGLPPVAGFWSKDAILSAAAEGAGWTAALVLAAGLVTAALTAWYATRLWLRVFFGTRRGAAQEGAPLGSLPQEGAPDPARAGAGRPASEAAPTGAPSWGAAHDPPAPMLWPIVALAVPSALLGLLALRALPAAPQQPPGARPTTWSGTETVVHVGVFMVVPLLAVVLGVAVAWWLWRRDPTADPARHLGRLAGVFAAGFHLDRVQQALVVRPVRALARAVRRADETVVDGAVEGSGRGAVALGALLAAAHRTGLPRAVGAVLAGALLLGLAAVVAFGGVR